MAGKKQAKGKKAVRKSAPRKAAPQRAPRAAPKAAAPAKVEQTYPCTVIVKKGAEEIPVIVSSTVHHARLINEFGEKNVELQKAEVQP